MLEAKIKAHEKASKDYWESCCKEQEESHCKEHNKPCCKEHKLNSGIDPDIKRDVPKIIVFREKQIPEYFKHDIFMWKDKVYFKINYKPTKFFVIDYKQNICFETTVSCTKDKDTGKLTCSENRQELYGNISFKKVIEYQPIFEGIPRQYRFECIDSYNNKIAYTGTYNDISTKIDEDGHLYNDRKIKEILKKAKALLQKRGNHFTSKLPPYPGFFWIDNKLQTNLVLTSKNKDLLKNALELLEILVGFYNENKYKVGYILSWMLMAPFNFAMKQAGNGELLGSTYLVGKANSGKTTIASLMMNIWNTTHTQTIFTAGSVDTVARFGGAISNMTYPVMFDEGSVIFNGHNNDIFDLFKSSIYDLKARTVMDTSRKSITIPSLSSIIFTSNLSAPKVAALGRRMHTFEFSVDHPRTPEEIEKFNATFDSHNRSGPMKTLSSIGDFVAISMLENPDYIKRSWLEVAIEMWKNMYSCVKMDVPDWITNYEYLQVLKKHGTMKKIDYLQSLKNYLLEMQTRMEKYMIKKMKYIGQELYVTRLNKF